MLKDSPTIILRNADEYDVFGDVTVVVKAAYGHTPGSQILLLRLKKWGPMALVVDLYHYPEERQARTICEDRYQVRSTILTSQLPVSRCLSRAGTNR